jgi:hypothetical protein
MVRGARGRVLDTLYLVGVALLVCAVGVGAFAVADLYHINLLWVCVSLISVGFVAFAREEYRKQFRSRRFVAFVCGWVVINVGVFIFFLGFFGWLWLIPALLIEQFVFYMTAYWFFGVLPPRRLWPFQRARLSDGDQT